MHDDRGAGKLLLNGLNHLEAQRLLLLELIGPWLVPIAAASKSRPVCFTNSTASSGLVRQPRLSRLLLITGVSSATLYGVGTEGKDPQLEL
jgi:hypothetical protein